MDTEKVLSVLKALRAENISEGDKRVGCSCLFAPWKHDKGTDNHPSAGISWKEGHPKYFCYACRSFGDLESIILELRLLQNTFPRREMDFDVALRIAEKVDTALPYFGSPDEYEKQEKGPIVYPEEWLDSFFPLVNYQPTEQAWDYFLARGGRYETALLYDIRVDSLRQRLCFPMRGQDGLLYGMTGRDYTGENPLRYYHYKYNGKSNKHIWLGEHLVDFDKPLILLEGPTDLLKLSAVYGNAMASVTSALTFERLQVLKDALQLISFYDFGLGGDNARRLLDKHFPGKVYHLIPPEEYGDVGAMPVELLHSMLSDIGVV